MVDVVVSSGVDVIDAGAEAGPTVASGRGLDGANGADEVVELDCGISTMEAALGVSEVSEPCRRFFFGWGSCKLCQLVDTVHQSAMLILCF